MNRYTKLTIAVLLAVAFGLGLYDIWVGSVAGGDSTISWVVWTASQRWPAIPFGLGYLMGHLTSQMIGPPAARAVKAVYRFTRVRSGQKQ